MNWHPGIGDPSIMGWVTVAAYFGTSVLALLTALKCRRANVETGFRFWGLLAIFLLLLGINKQLDLQSFFTEIGRMLARDEGWYRERRSVQFVFVVIIGFAGVIAVFSVWYMLRNEWRNYLLPLTGFLLLVTFIIIRAASFHHVERLLKSGPAGVRMNWIMELGGILIIAIGGIYSNSRVLD